MVPTIIARDEMIAKAEIVKANRLDQVRNVAEPARLGAPAGRVLLVDDHRLLEAMATAWVRAAGVAPLNEGRQPRVGGSVVAGPGPRRVPATLPAKARRPGAAVERYVAALPTPGQVAVGRAGRQMLAGLTARVIRARADGPAVEAVPAAPASGTGPRTGALGMVEGSPVHVPVAMGSRALRVGMDIDPTASVVVAAVMFAISVQIVQ